MSKGKNSTASLVCSERSFLACQMYLSVNSILIRPVIPPTRTHPPFSCETAHLYVCNTWEGWRIGAALRVEKLPSSCFRGEQQGIGRSYSSSERSLDEKSATDLAIDMIKETSRSLVLVPNDAATFSQE